MIISPVPFRLQVLKALTDSLKAITPANGYQYDLSDALNDPAAVVRGRLVIGDDEPPVMVTIHEPQTIQQPIPAPFDALQDAGEWLLMIQGYAKDDMDNEPCDLAYLLATEVRHKLHQELLRKQPARPGAADFFGFGSKIERITIGSPIVMPTTSPNVSGYGVFYLILSLKIGEDFTFVSG